jgi:hypothetical protein
MTGEKLIGKSSKWALCSPFILRLAITPCTEVASQVTALMASKNKCPWNASNLKHGTVRVALTWRIRKISK